MKHPFSRPHTKWKHRGQPAQQHLIDAPGLLHTQHSVLRQWFFSCVYFWIAPVRSSSVIALL